ncbi:MAG: nickel pincer cofactor biosynthesis protein LarB [Methanophagales archaeon]|nr:nickel pincer cofactor biosynthesis protein LarB [Methanophagales archaeon]NQE54320.1 N5-carboxyaminoimidazole ribonucleotide mutase [ANME-1 cluster archaeon GoMg3.2]
MEEILRRFGRGEIGIEEASKELKLESIRKIRDFARIDINRSYRTGIPEIIFAEGKSNNEVADIAIAVASEKGFALISRVREAEMIKKRVVAETKELDVDYNAISSTIVVKKRGYEFERRVKIGLIAAGTADIPVAEEARVVAEVCGCEVIKTYDVGIAGIHRLASPLEAIVNEDVVAIIVVAGMEGALPSVVASLVNVPVIGVPTSVGYGLGGKGIAALLSMLQSCSPGLAVVNIDNGVGAATIAAKMCVRRKEESPNIIKNEGCMTIEENIGYSFVDKSILNRALTRKAYALEQRQRNQACEDQEIFRTLGDAVLKAVLVDLLIKSGCKTRDEITRKKIELEREESLAKIGRELGIGESIMLGVGEKKQRANEEPYVLAETFEAVIGAIYLDGGYDTAEKIITILFKTKS